MTGFQHELEDQQPVIFTATREGDQVRLEGRTYALTFAVDKLAGWIVFYDRMFKKHGKASYRQTAEALRGIDI